MNEDSLRHELKVYKASLEQQVAPPGMVRGPSAKCADTHPQHVQLATETHTHTHTST